jgi:hypothetical protein
MKITQIIVALFLIVVSTQAQIALDQKNHCDALLEQARGLAAQLRIPSLVVGGAVPSAGTPPQIYTGVQNSLSSDKKAAAAIQLASRTCSLYSTTEDATLRLLYAAPDLQKTALDHRAAIDSTVETQLDALIADAQKRVEAQNLPRPALYLLRSSKTKLEMDRAAALQTASMLYIPEGMNPAPISQLLSIKQQEEIIVQKATEKVDRTASWDVLFEGGVHHQLASTSALGLSSSSSSGGVYGGATLTWGLGTHKADKHFDKAVTAYGKWKEAQEGDTIRAAAALKKLLTDSISVLASNLKILQDQGDAIDANLELVKDADTSASLAFKMQLQADRLLLRVEVEDTQFRLDALQTYLADNF